MLAYRPTVCFTGVPHALSTLFTTFGTIYVDNEDTIEVCFNFKMYFYFIKIEFALDFQVILFFWRCQSAQNHYHVKAYTKLLWTRQRDRTFVLSPQTKRFTPSVIVCDVSPCVMSRSTTPVQAQSPSKCKYSKANLWINSLWAHIPYHMDYCECAFFVIFVSAKLFET